MKRNIIRTVFLVLFLILIWKINIYADSPYIVDEKYEGDTNYGVKAFRNGNENEKLSYEITRTTGDKSSIMPYYNLTIKGNDKLYASDFVYLEFVVIHPGASDAWLQRDVKKCVLSKPANSPADVSENDIEAGYNRDGTFHTRVKVKKIQLKSTDKVGFNLYIANSDTGLVVHVWIEDIGSAETKTADEALSSQKTVKKKSELLGFKKSDVINYISDVKSATEVQITREGILKRKDVIDQINYSETQDTKLKAYTTSSVAKIATIKNELTIDKDRKVFCYDKAGYWSGEYRFDWVNKPLYKGHKYRIKYTFAYYPQIGELWYQVTYSDLTANDTAAEKKADENTDALQRRNRSRRS